MKLRSFNPSRGIAIIQTPQIDKLIRAEPCFNPSRGIAIIQTPCCQSPPALSARFQSLTRDSNHSNLIGLLLALPLIMFQSLTRDSNHSNRLEFWGSGSGPFQSLTRDSNHSNECNKSVGLPSPVFQSLTRDSNHSNLRLGYCRRSVQGFNPSRGIAIIQT